MKKTLIASLLGLFMAMPALATGFGSSSNSLQRGFGTEVRRASFDFVDDKYIGFRIGASFSTAGNDDPMLDACDIRTGLNIGAVVGIPLSDSTPLFLESGLFYVEKGGKNDRALYIEDGKKKEGKVKYNLNYLEIPIVLKYKYDIDDDFSVQPFLGGYVACGVGGKIKNYANRDIRASFSGNAFRRFDGGIKLGVGGQYDLFYFELGYDLGLANIGNDSFDTIHNSSLSINVGINF